MVYAQKINVNIRLEWQKEKNTFAINGMAKMDSISIPYLIISYSNHDTLNYYFYKLTKGQNECPRISSILEETTYNYCDIDASSFSFQKHKDNFSTIQIAFNHEYFARGWQIQYGTPNERINILSELNAFHDIIELQKYLNKEKRYRLSLFNYKDRKLISFKETSKLFSQKNKQPVSTPLDLPWETIGIQMKDLSPEGINTKLGELFLFLKAGDTYVDRIALTPFYLVGGTYQFCLQSSHFPSYLVCTSWNEETKIFSFPKKDFPKEVNGYKLYTGEIKADTVTLSIK